MTQSTKVSAVTTLLKKWGIPGLKAQHLPFLLYVRQVYFYDDNTQVYFYISFLSEYAALQRFI